ncbi:glycerophosphoryl diester phosphodiesterase [Cohnella sp. SGD-V74]|uniref:glycerophosphodiester phosphodiesterase n=1 Tax=unclassified Cohnella TaxID=2636738 RepID=UPI000B8C0D2C|nr:MULTISPECIES: glycerophosphodiester phosphodiesterase [unclassified Cohnella]PRX67085.1 glycerophosphoryl diester phosphodiesterase [Cohnella sp. SGD-V74]
MKIWGHRGAYSSAPENTLSAFQLAAQMGADGVELDIQLTRDGEIVVIHDETVDRTSNGQGWVKDFTLSEIKKLNFNKRGIAEPLHMEVPTLAEVLELLKPTSLTVNIELKTGVVYYEGIERQALQLVDQYGMADRVVWSSFNHYSVQKIKQLEPSAGTALLCGGGILVTGEQCEKVGAEALHPHVKMLRYPALAEDCRKRGILIRTWTVNSDEELELAMNLGVDTVIVNRIDWAKGVLAHGN